MTRPTIAYINLEALINNFQVIKSLLIESGRDENSVICAVKANAYGHGAIRITRTLEEAGARFFAVSCIEEAVELREAGIESDILVLSPVRSGEVKELLKGRFIGVLIGEEDIEIIENEISNIKAAHSPLQLFLKIDTGMGRAGIFPEQLESFAVRANSCPLIKVTGLLSHLSCAGGGDEDDQKYTMTQIEDFELAIKTSRSLFKDIKHYSLANSAGIISFPKSMVGLVRPGIALYGVSPFNDDISSLGFKPVMSVETKIDRIRDFPAGSCISYGRVTKLKRPSRVAMIPIGYEDGLQRRLSPGFNLGVRGKPAPILGVVTMDYAMIDVTDIKDAAPEDRVLVLGREGNLRICAEDHAARAGTIAYEILTSIGNRVRRIYTNG